MYVVKKLASMQAVQTLWRLKRMAPGKSRTFVLDFVNEEATSTRRSSPTTRRRLLGIMPISIASRCYNIGFLNGLFSAQTT